ncbi:MAG: type II secretion system protein [Butyrivibrio sp.]
MKLFQKKKNNKGFSLVELIVVVAIMAVLLGVLVPTLVRHIESSRLSKDKKNLDELRVAMEVALANEEFADIECTDLAIGSDDSVDISGKTFDSTEATNTAFINEVKSNFSNKSTVTLTSKLKKGCEVTVTIKDGRVEISVDADENGNYDFSIPEEEEAE